MAPPPEHTQTLLDLQARHDELLRLVEDLEQRVAAVLAQWQAPSRQPGLVSPAQAPASSGQ